ncbi:Fe-S cluster assembly protein SufD [Methylocella sp. CPCC 101449]|uniref:Fe-S cluster assembly protein SufD n=1 Tax=Methylocella sp. CPCC 101449 TaxID=2987531 RepID=UPI002891DCF6|nr:Fe-S cluster assembly protein SufD [Methylocella sp. CPCC 101449]MDT2021458.1 Fe-S cluster assembly protein SufD [Methylocella sp. CPCC 101449]
MAVQLQTVRTPAEEAILARLAEGGRRHTQTREKAVARLRANGLPNRRVEAWHYTDLRTLMRDAPPPFEAFTDDLVAQAMGQSAALSLKDAAHVLFVNGRFVRHAGALEVVDADTGDQAAAGDAYGDDGAVALHRAFAGRTTTLRVPPSHRSIVHLDFREIGTDAFSTFPHLVIEVVEGADVLILETHRGPNEIGYQTHALIEFHVASSAKVEHVRVNEAGNKALSLSTLGVDLAARAAFQSFSLSLGANVARHQIFLRSLGEHAKIGLAGASLLRGRQHADTTLVVDHTAPRCQSREFYRYIVDDMATGVFQGKIVVAPNAQKTDGGMKSQTILLSDTAAMNNKPELEIFADDVICGHGATCGSLNENQLFYAHARGIPPAEAEALLLEAFAGEAVDRVGDEQIREQLMDKVRDWLAQRVKS